MPQIDDLCWVQNRYQPSNRIIMGLMGNPKMLDWPIQITFMFKLIYFQSELCFKQRYQPPRPPPPFLVVKATCLNGRSLSAAWLNTSQYLSCFSSRPRASGRALLLCYESAFSPLPAPDVSSTFVPLVGHANVLPVLQYESHCSVKRLCLCHDETGCFTFTRF